MRGGCCSREKASAKLNSPAPLHQPWLRARCRSSACSAVMSVPMLSWLEMLRLPSAEVGADQVKGRPKGTGLPKNSLKLG